MSKIEQNGDRGFVFKIVIIGDGAVGKTSLIKKYTQGTFQKDYIKTLGAQFSKYDEEVNGNNVKLFFWDIAGQSEFKIMRGTFFKGSKAAIIVFSHTDEESYMHISEWHDEFVKHCGEQPVVLFGNKIDLVEEEGLNDERVQTIVDKRDFLGYYKTSAKTGEGVFKAFRAIIEKLYELYKET
ncbi:MAG: Rab family GTPase [Promethearchaeia archaeon]